MGRFGFVLVLLLVLRVSAGNPWIVVCVFWGCGDRLSIAGSSGGFVLVRLLVPGRNLILPDLGGHRNRKRGACRGQRYANEKFMQRRHGRSFLFEEDACNYLQ